MWSLFLALALTFVSPQEPVETQPAVELRRNWPEQGSVGVVETRGRLDGSYTLAYRLAWAPTTDGRVRLRCESPALTLIDGISADSPQVNIARRQREPQLLVLCDFEVDAQGAFVQVLELDAAVQRALESCVRRKVISLAEADRLRVQLLDPRNRFALVKPMRDLWEQWSGAWHGRTVRAGVGERVELQLPIGADNTPSPATRTWTLVSHTPEELSVRLTTLQEGAEFTRIVQNISNAPLPPEKHRTILSCRREVTTEAVFADGLRLLRYNHTTQARTQYEGEQDPRLEQESRSFVVDWTPLPMGPAPTESQPHEKQPK